MIEAKSLGLDEARKIVEAALEATLKAKGRPISAAVVDSAGDLISFDRMDGASLNSVTVAQNKAYTAVRFGRDTKDIRTLLEQGYDIVWFGNPRYAPIRGGVLIKSGDGSIVGAVGISGRSPTETPNDEDVAQIGAKAVHV